MPIHCNRAFGHIVETHKKINQRGLTSTSRTYNGNHFSRFDLQIEIPNERLVCYILEVHILEANLTCQILIQLFCLIIDFVCFVQHLENPVQRRLGTLQLTSQLSQVLNGLVNLPDILNKSLHIPDCQAPSNNLKAAQQGQQEVGQI